MLKKEALSLFKKDILPWVKNRYEPNGVVDKVARREAWSTFVDNLNKEGKVSNHQRDTWACPKICH